MTRSGRRPGPTETRAHILAAARAQFAAHGYRGATIRAIATDAGVNPALVHHFFGSKEKVFAAALDLPLNPDLVVTTLLAGPRDEIPERLVRLFLTLWSAPESSKSLHALIRSISTSEAAAAMLRQFLERAMLAKVTEALGIPRLRATAIASHLVGLALVRYIIKVEPLASATDDEVVALLTPVLRLYLTKD
ncbi:TetR/AcrR family transcriptional regulator [Actinokineospora diospyrosa]|uniref:Transcriptional regulator, TetR family n=1 Tax=Actinokineospora diospyrosa TaxID=103728 RepID=A0ABT1IJY7_9PSEU|nr:TetR family transcriptional regulator [Actinokineospora diospyrosa]MCP2272970.1 transcriptional regulator, TetR family [Actinokineospora diospyrosa]